MNGTTLFQTILLLGLWILLGACSSDTEEDTTDGDLPSDGDASTDDDDDDSDEGDGDATDGDTEAEADRFPVCDQTAASQTITFVHTNDLHSSYQMPAGTDGENPFALIRGYYKEVLAENPFTLLTDGGDSMEKGSVAEQLSQGLSTVEMMLAMKYDVRVIGNHDFAWGEQPLLALADDPYAVVLASNTTYTGSDPRGFKAVPYAEMQVGCVKIGFFGMHPLPYNERNTTYEGPYMPNFETRYDYDVLAQEILDAHRQDVDLMVMVSHLGKGTDEALAETLTGLDVILGGHSHSTINPPETVNGVLIIQAGSNAAFVYRLDLEMDLTSMRLASHSNEFRVVLPGALPLDEDMQATAEDVFSRHAPNARDDIAWIKVNSQAARVAEVTAKAALSVLQADAALADDDTVWKTWSSGPLSQQKMLDTYCVERQPAGTPGFNGYYTVTLSGAGLRAVAAMNAEHWVYLGPESIDDQQTYTLALQKHAAYNPDVYLPEGVTISEPVFALEAWQVLEQYGKARSAQCKYMDTDEDLSPCP